MDDERCGGERRQRAPPPLFVLAKQEQKNNKATREFIPNFISDYYQIQGQESNYGTPDVVYAHHPAPYFRKPQTSWNKSNNPTSRNVLHKPTLINFRHPQTTGLQAHISCVHTPSKRTSRGSVVISHNTWFCEEHNEYAIVLIFSLSFLSTRCLPAKGGGRVDLRFVTDKKRQL